MEGGGEGSQGEEEEEEEMGGVSTYMPTMATRLKDSRKEGKRRKDGEEEGRQLGVVVEENLIGAQSRKCAGWTIRGFCYT